MDTKEKTREQAAQSRPRQNAPEGAAKRPQGEAKPRAARQAVTPPASAQQNNGAARTEQEQRGTAQKPARKKPAAPASGKPAQKKPAAPAKKRPAPKADPDDISTKKRAYGKSKPKKKSGIAAATDIFRRTAQNAVARTEKKAASRNSRSKRPQQPAPAVIYTQPQAFNRNRLLVQLLTVTAVVVALVLGLSVFFKVETITVSGAEVYSAWAIREASGISEGDNLLTFSHARAGALIKANLPYVKSVRFGIKLPDTVNIIIEEEDVVYAIKSHDGTWWLMNSQGRVVEQTNSSKAANYTQIHGVALDNPAVNEKAVAVESIPTETDANGEFIPVTVTGAQRLNITLQILEALEANDIVGAAASIDVSRTEEIILWYGTRYQVILGDSSRLDYKIACMNDVILQMSDYQSGILDISFTHWPDKVGYTPFA